MSQKVSNITGNVSSSAFPPTNRDYRKTFVPSADAEGNPALARHLYDGPSVPGINKNLRNRELLKFLYSADSVRKSFAPIREPYGWDNEDIEIESPQDLIDAIPRTSEETYDVKEDITVAHVNAIPMMEEDGEPVIEAPVDEDGLQCVFLSTCYPKLTVLEDQLSTAIVHSPPEDDAIVQHLMSAGELLSNESCEALNQVLSRDHDINFEGKGVVYSGIKVFVDDFKRDFVPGTIYFCAAFPRRDLRRFKCSHGNEAGSGCCYEFLALGRLVLSRPVDCVFEIPGCLATSRLIILKHYDHGIGWGEEDVVYGVVGPHVGKWGKKKNIARYVFREALACFGVSVTEKAGFCSARWAVHSCDQRDSRHCNSPYFEGH